MQISDFSDQDGYGLCCTVPFEGKDLILSHCFDNGTHGVREAVDKVIQATSEGPVIAARYSMIYRMCETEVDTGMLMTSRGGGAIRSIKREWNMTRNLARKKVPIVMSLVLSLAKLQLQANAKHA